MGDLLKSHEAVQQEVASLTNQLAKKEEQMTGLQNGMGLTQAPPYRLVCIWFSIGYFVLMHPLVVCMVMVTIVIDLYLWHQRWAWPIIQLSANSSVDHHVD